MSELFGTRNVVNYIKLYYDTLSHFKFQQPSTHFYTFTERVLFIIVAKISQNCSGSAFLFVKIYRKVSSIRVFKRLIGKEAQQNFSRRTKW